ncbi:hypothetical protein BgiBS90_024198 [Biomphalaria glabrata]|nr:hypothetical protein BgiBS90_024198 [Biomphalaria glabrata]
MSWHEPTPVIDLDLPSALLVTFQPRVTSSGYQDTPPSFHLSPPFSSPLCSVGPLCLQATRSGAGWTGESCEISLRYTLKEPKEYFEVEELRIPPNTRPELDKKHAQDAITRFMLPITRYKYLFIRFNPPIKREKPPIIRYNPLITREKPPIIRYNPLITREKPPIIRYKYLFIRFNPPIKREKPPIIRYNPLITREKPPIIRYNPPIKREKPPIIRYNPLITREKPPIIRYNDKNEVSQRHY